MKLEQTCDNLCREIVRLRDKGICRLCQNPGCEVHHIARKGGNVRWFLDNLLWICRKCHTHDDEVTMNWNIVRVIGAQKFEELIQMSHEIKQWRTSDLAVLREDLGQILNYYRSHNQL